MIQAAINYRVLNFESDMPAVCQLVKQQYANQTSDLLAMAEAVINTYAGILASGSASVHLVFADTQLLFLVEAHVASKHDCEGIVAKNGDYIIDLLYGDISLKRPEEMLFGFRSVLAFYFRSLPMTRAIIPHPPGMNPVIRKILILAGFIPFSSGGAEPSPPFYQFTTASFQDFAEVPDNSRGASGY